MYSSGKEILARRISFSIALVVTGVALVTRGVENTAARAAGFSAFANAPLYFEQNAGQLDGAAQFIARGSECSVLLAPSGAEILLGKSSDRTVVHSASDARSVRLQLLGANPASKISGRDPMAARANYFIGNEPAKWHTGVALFSKVQVDDVYPGVRVIYYANQSAQLEYDFLLQPGVPADQIHFRIEGADNVRVDEAGNLVLKIGDEEIRQHKPVAYQETGGARKEVQAAYHLNADGSVGFALAGYDRNLPLVIDPVLDFLTYVGGKKMETGWAIALDAETNIYVAGETLSTDLPTTNSIQFTNKVGNLSIFQGGERTFGDAFVAKYDNSGVLQFLTYLGGKTDDGALGLAFDSSNGGAVWITGFTDSTNFPLMNPLRDHLTGQNKNAKKIFPVDAFITKLDPSGTNLLFSTFFGGEGLDEGVGITTDPAGNVYVTGFTTSLTNFATPNAYQTNLHGNFDVFVTKLTSTGPNIYTNAYTTYFGGTNSEYGLSIAVDSSQDAWVTGLTFSTNFFTTNALQLPPGADAFFTNGITFTNLNTETNNPRHNAAFHSDAFVTEFSPDGSTVPFSTYLGGTNDEVGEHIVIDNSDNVFVTGYTLSRDFPTNVLTTQTTNMYGMTNIIILPVTNFSAHTFVTQITGNALAYSTHFGGTGADLGMGIAVDANGLVYVTGSAGSTNTFAQKMLVITNSDPTLFHTNRQGDITSFPGYLTNNPTFTNLSSTNVTVKLNHGGNTNDVFVAVLSPHLTNLVYSILLGGPGEDDPHGIAVDPSGAAVYIVGSTTSSTNFATTNAAQRGFGGSKSSRLSDGFVSKIQIVPSP